MRFLFSLFLFLITIPGFSAGEHYLAGKIRGLDRQKIYLASVNGERISKVDSTVSDSTGEFRFSVSDRIPSGMYRILSGKDVVIDIILNREDVEFVTDVFSLADSLRFLKSEENRVYYLCMNLDRLTQDKLGLLTPVLDFYPEKDKYYQSTAVEFERIQKKLSGVFDSVTKAHPDFFAVRIIRLQQTPFIPASVVKNERLNFLKAHYLDKVDFTDTIVLHSNAWSNKAISYLSLYSNNRLSQQQLEAEFIKGITVILSAASVNPYVFKFLLDYYLGGFDKYHFDEVITYMADNFQDPFACEDPARKSGLQKKLDTYKRLSPGKTAPDLELPDRNGKNITLSSVKTDYTLLVFWSSQCSHCVEMMPKLKDLYDKQKQKKMEVIAVSLDTDRKQWTDFVSDNKFRWIDVSDLKGFDSKAANDYNVYASPTMFLLDKDKKIVAKPVSFRELENNLAEFGIR